VPTHATASEPPQSPILAAIRAREEQIAAAAEEQRRSELDSVMGATRLAEEEPDSAAEIGVEAD